MDLTLITLLTSVLLSVVICWGIYEGWSSGKIWILRLIVMAGAMTVWKSRSDLIPVPVQLSDQPAILIIMCLVTFDRGAWLMKKISP